MSNEQEIYIDEHPRDEDLASLVEGNISPWLREKIVDHITQCEKCSFVVSQLVKLTDQVGDIEVHDNNSSPIQIAVVNGDVNNQEVKEETAKKGRPWRRTGDTFYFWIAASMMILAFLFANYQSHLLIASAFFGILATIDYSQRSIFLPLINAWREGDDAKAAQAIDDIKQRLKIS